MRARNWALGLRLQARRTTTLNKHSQRALFFARISCCATWHFVTPLDIRWLLALTAPRVHLANAHMYRQLELDSDTFQRSNTALATALQGGQRLTRDELQEVLQKAGIATEGGFRMSYLLMRAELDGIICSGPRRGKQFTYALPAWQGALQAKTPEREEAELAELVAVTLRAVGQPQCRILPSGQG